MKQKARKVEDPFQLLVNQVVAAGKALREFEDEHNDIFEKRRYLRRRTLQMRDVDRADIGFARLVSRELRRMGLTVDRGLQDETLVVRDHRDSDAVSGTVAVMCFADEELGMRVQVDTVASTAQNNALAKEIRKLFRDAGIAVKS